MRMKGKKSVTHLKQNFKRSIRSIKQKIGEESYSDLDLSDLNGRARVAGPTLLAICGKIDKIGKAQALSGVSAALPVGFAHSLTYLPPFSENGCPFHNLLDGVSP